MFRHYRFQDARRRPHFAITVIDAPLFTPARFFSEERTPPTNVIFRLRRHYFRHA